MTPRERTWPAWHGPVLQLRRRRSRASGSLFDGSRFFTASVDPFFGVGVVTAGPSCPVFTPKRHRRAESQRLPTVHKVTCNIACMANRDINRRVADHRTRLREQGLRPLQIWVPDTRAPGFAEEAHRQSALVAASSSAAEDQAWVDDISQFNDADFDAQ